MNRLNQSQIVNLPADVALPQYDRSRIKAGILHLGIGAFHRAHQAFYTEAVLNQYGGDWGIIGCSLRSTNVRDQLAPQDGLYTLVERTGNSEKIQLVGAVIQNIVGPENPSELVRLMAQPNIKIVSLTITEKGYCHDPATGELDNSHPDIVHDLKNFSQPKSAIGFLVAALDARFEADEKSFTVLSCDNFSNNGKMLEKIVLQFAEKISKPLAGWIAANTCFPATMIDRIVPTTSNEDRNQIESSLGMRDAGMVITEPFSQWVIEDKFSNGRPQWEKVGALLVNSDDVHVFEKIKLRLLNGSHFIMAYTGYLSGFNYISELMDDPAFVNMVRSYMMNEAGATLTSPAGFNIATYHQQLLNRFANKALKHRTSQIAMDGSQKLPQRLLESLRTQLKHNGQINIICLGVAAWIRYITGVDEQGNAIAVADPLAQELRALCEANKGDARTLVHKIVSLQKIFGKDLICEERFLATTTEWLEKFYAKGVLPTITQAFK